ncbi:MAG: 3-dehydroquinate synthase [Phycisphaerales bacterium]|nr:3-dehydroquinate synthase [Phycisphaerae bacterium]NNF41778.1 3-dehydroquinate synthase [Phycisphaerales bacterium]NNM24542.1 3-dehydroquinate synthase [Phycisphaerales bacterium]
MKHVIDVTTPGGAYPIHIEPGGLTTLGGFTRSVAPAGRVLVVVDERVAADHGVAAEASLASAGYEVTRHVLTATEEKKTLDSVRAIYDTQLAARLDRRCPLVAVGGGITGDVGGFAAATYLRGVPLIQVPTTLLAMVDAAIGGKTGVNHPRPEGPLGKNLVGAFWQPRGVIVDPRTLDTLPARHLRCGLAESIKHAVIADAGLLELIESSVDAVLAGDDGVRASLIARSAQVKVDIVEQDEREAGVRALLNLGHTFAHAIEPVPEQKLHHGEAVAIGMCAATQCAVATKRLTTDEGAAIVAAITACGLPATLPHAMPMTPLLTAMGYDKKVADGRLRLVLPVAIGRAVVADDVPSDVIAAAWRSVGATEAAGS